MLAGCLGSRVVASGSDPGCIMRGETFELGKAALPPGGGDDDDLDAQIQASCLHISLFVWHALSRYCGSHGI